MTTSSSSLSTLGRRVERLLYFGSVLVILCFGTLYFALASQTNNADSVSELDRLIAFFEQDKDRLIRLFTSAPDRKPSKPSSTQRERDAAESRRLLGLPPPTEPSNNSGETYASALRALSDRAANQLSYSAATGSIAQDSRLAPDEIISRIRARKNELATSPVTVWGISSPRLVPMSYGGATYQLPADFVATAALSALTPLVLGWLTSLFITRQRELLAVRGLRGIEGTFPHVLNVFALDWANVTPLHHRLMRRKRDRRGETLIGKIWCASFRTFVILVFAAPMTFLLAYSGSLLASHRTLLPLIILGLVFVLWALMQTLMLVIQEWLLLWDKEFYA